MNDFMKLKSTYLRDTTLFPIEKTSISSPTIETKKQIHDSSEQQIALAKIDDLEKKLTQHFHNKIKLQPDLTRQLVSFQANKPRPTYRWYKYKEAFSASLIEMLLSKYGITSGKRCHIGSDLIIDLLLFQPTHHQSPAF